MNNRHNNGPSEEGTIKAATASAEDMSKRAIMALKPEQLPIFLALFQQMVEAQKSLIDSGNYRVWRELLASMNRLEAEAEKHFGKEFIDAALREEDQ